MCGISGVVGEVRPDDRRLVRAMCDAMRHRGPDDEGYLDADGICLGMRRLSIIDVSHGQQPVISEDGKVGAVFNGEIYNYPQLQDSLRAAGHRLASSSDSECLPHLYEEHGVGLLEHLRGMFAIAVWDAEREQLLLARDRVGKKPLFYWQEGGRLWFASELKCLLALPHLPRAVDPQALDHYLTYQYVPAPWSIIQGVRKLPPAHRLTWRSRTSTVERYWRLNYAPESPASTPAPATPDLEEQLRHQILDATKIRMVSERPLGAFLSGGLDSSAVVAAMAMQSDLPVSTFSIGFEDEEFNELPYARRVAEQYGTKHHELVVKPDVVDLLPRLARMFDEPYADSSAVPSYYVAEMARREVVVVLNGDGGDEALGGYGRYARFIRPGIEVPIPGPLARTAARAAAAAYRRPTRSHRFNALTSLALRASAPDAPARYGRQISYFTTEEKQAIYRPDFLAAVGNTDSYSLLREVWQRESDTDNVNRLLAMDVETYLPGDLLPKVDITTMAVSLEARSPLLDQELLEWAAGLPGSLKVNQGRTKVLFKQALRDWLPDDLINRPKRGFAIPLERWLRADLRQMVGDLLLGRDAAIYAYVEPTEVARLVRNQERHGVGSSQVWALLMLELFLREVVAPEHPER